MNRMRAFLWTSIIGGGLLIASGSAFADGGHGRQVGSSFKHRPKIVKAYDNGRGKLVRTFRRGSDRFHSKGYYVRRHGRYYWVKDHRHFPRRFWKRYHRRGYWGHGPVRRPPHTVIIEREVEVENDSSSIRIGPDELSVVIPLPW